MSNQSYLSGRTVCCLYPITNFLIKINERNSGRQKSTVNTSFKISGNFRLQDYFPTLEISSSQIAVNSEFSWDFWSTVRSKLFTRISAFRSMACIWALSDSLALWRDSIFEFALKNKNKTIMFG